MNFARELAVFGAGNKVLMQIKDKKCRLPNDNRRMKKMMRKLVRAARRGERNKTIREGVGEID